MVGTAQAQAVGGSQLSERIESKVDRLLGQMSLDEKISLIHGNPDGFSIGPVPRLKIPRVAMSDGPMGSRNYGPATAFAAGLCLASTFDPDLAFRMGRAMGKEARARGVGFLLAPAVNIYRGPWCGRNFEYYGEDPYLAGQTAAAFIRGVQSAGVIATVKHFALNNQEDERNSADSVCDEQTMREVYFPAFEAAVKEGGAWAVMCSYNKVNGTYASANRHLLTEVLKDDWGFPGLVMSDWGAVHDTLGPALAGLDLEMPKGEYWAPEKLKPLIASGKIPTSVIDDKVRRIPRVLETFHLLDQERKQPQKPQEVSESAAVNLEAARKGIVLARNANGALPLDRTKVRQVAVFGPNAQPAVTGGGGSSTVTPSHATSVLDGLIDVSGPRVDIHWVPWEGTRSAEAFQHSTFLGPDGRPGLLEEQFDNMRLEGTPSWTGAAQTVDREWGEGPAHNGGPVDHFAIRWRGSVVVSESGEYEFIVASDDGARLWLDGRLVIDKWVDRGETEDAATLQMVAGRPVSVRLEYYENGGTAACHFGYRKVRAASYAKEQAAAKAADAAVVCVGFGPSTEAEGFDRTFSLPRGQDELIEAVAAANPRTIVVVNSGGQVDDSRWRDKVAAVLYAWYPGAEGGWAVAEILFGDVNPSGQFAYTEYSQDELPGVEKRFRPRNGTVSYSERKEFGIRQFRLRRGASNPDWGNFGTGLSYTTFDRAVVGQERRGADVVLRVKVVNTGNRDGETVVQAYVRKPGPWLAAFKRVALKAGESKVVLLTIAKRAFARYQPESHAWWVKPGDYTVIVLPGPDVPAGRTTVHWE